MVSEANASVSPVPFSEQFVTISKKEYIQLRCDAGYYRALSERWKSKYEESQEVVKQGLAQISKLKKLLFGRKSEKKRNKSEAANSNGAAGESAKQRGA